MEPGSPPVVAPLRGSGGRRVRPLHRNILHLPHGEEVEHRGRDSYEPAAETSVQDVAEIQREIRAILSHNRSKAVFQRPSVMEITPPPSPKGKEAISPVSRVRVVFVMAARKTERQSPASCREGEGSEPTAQEGDAALICLLGADSTEKNRAGIDFYLHQYCTCL